MVITGLIRLKCYAILDGLERSLADNITRNFDTNKPDFFSPDEQEKALKRFHEDTSDSSIDIGSLYSEEFLRYLDLGDLIGILNRHAKSSTTISSDDISQASKEINVSGALSIRKRVMHPVRPLEIDDFQKLLVLASRIQKVSPSLFWSPLSINLRRISKNDIFIEQDIPDYWEDESRISHNLPPAEFDETGFIGRRKERKDLYKLLSSEHRVITVVGGGGLGKTALTLKVCNDILENQDELFDRIIWVSLKTKYLTHEGIRDINNAIDSIGYLIESLSRMVGEDESSEPENTWDRVISQLTDTKTLLVIDNLETVGDELRELALNIPPGSKLLLTSRVGLGEIEVRYELSSFLPKDAIALFRSLSNIYNFTSLMSIPSRIVNNYAQSLHFNPLLIKWFVLAVGTGADPTEQIKGRDLEEALSFCYENVYKQLNRFEKDILAIIMAARRDMTNAQLIDLTNTDLVTLVAATHNLVRSSMARRIVSDDGTGLIQISGIVYDYLRKRHPPSNEIVLRVRSTINKWQIAQDNTAVRLVAYRYDKLALEISNADERISANHLGYSIKAIRKGDLKTAEDEINRAEAITPMWGEVYRIKAILLEQQNHPIYEIESAYEQSIQYNDGDISRYHYAVYLIKTTEYERAIEHLQIAKRFDEANISVLDSQLGVALLRSGHAPEAIELMQKVWANRSNTIPTSIGRIQGTQLSDAYRRNMDQMKNRGNPNEIISNLLNIIDIIDECIRMYGCDGRLVQVAIDSVSIALVSLRTDSESRKKVKDAVSLWDNNNFFQSCINLRNKTTDNFERFPELSNYFPHISAMLSGAEGIESLIEYSGKIEDIYHREPQPFGFISSDELNSVYFNIGSLIDSSEWSLLKKDVPVVFELNPLSKPRPSAKNLRIDVKQ